ncbi:MAG TPA: type IV pilus assembly protein PilM [Chthonomonadales bacterium]|nr:type IV pilus assembly protein PilM [Chthonomonadales bacterium]
MAAGSYVGLDIGSKQIKVAELRRSGQGYEVTALGAAPTPIEAYENSIIVDAQLLGQAVKTLLNRSGVRSRSCVSSVSSQSGVAIRIFDLPQMTPSEMAESMKWEVEKHVPFSASEVIMDYQQIDRADAPADGQNVEVLLAVAQQELIDRHVEVLFAAGLKPVAIDIEPLAVGRSLLDMGPAENEAPGHTVAIVTIGAANTDISIFRDRVLAYSRTLPLAGDQLDRAISESMGIALDAAETLKCQSGEVILGQTPQVTPDFGGAAGFGGASGFVDFTAPQAAPAPEPLVQTSSPSGRMPFDFSSPGEAPVPSAAAPVDLSASADATPPAEAPATRPVESSGDSGFFAPEFPAQAPAPNLPAVTSGAADATKVHVFNAMAPVLSELAIEIRRSLDYYKSQHADAQIDRLLLAGGSARLPNLPSYLETELGIPAQVAERSGRLEVNAKGAAPESASDLTSVFPVCIGLAARDLLPDSGAGKGKARKK